MDEQTAFAPAVVVDETLAYEFLGSGYGVELLCVAARFFNQAVNGQTAEACGDAAALERGVYLSLLLGEFAISPVAFDA